MPSAGTQEIHAGLIHVVSGSEQGASPGVFSKAVAGVELKEGKPETVKNASGFM